MKIHDFDAPPKDNILLLSSKKLNFCITDKYYYFILTFSCER